MAAGLGFKTFTTGEVLTAADVNGYLMQGVLVFASAAARNAAITSPQEGQFAFTKDTNGLWYYDGAAWVASGATGDIEGVTAGVGISGGGTSGTVTVTNSMATAIDAKGDLVPGTGADTFARLAIGANGTILTADSAEATGMKWAAAAGGGGMTLLASGSLTTSGIDLTSISGAYEELQLVISDIDMSTSDESFIRINNDTGGNYYGYFAITSGASSSQNVINGATYFKVDQNYMSTTANGAVVILNLPNYSNTTGYKIVRCQSAYVSGGGGNESRNIWGYWKDESAITRITFATGGAYFDGGTYELFGVK